MLKTTSCALIMLSTLLSQASAQLLSCSDINCPMKYGTAECNIEDVRLIRLGVATFSSSLSPKPLTWTIGFTPEVFTNTTDQRRYYLGTPQGLDLNTRTDFAGCALFFTGIEAGLSFYKPNGSDVDPDTVSGTCADALGSTCVSDLVNQAQSLAANSVSSGNLQCSEIAQALEASAPLSCTSAGNWGGITAKEIAGPDSSPILQLGDCIPTTNRTYNLHNVATFSRLGKESFESNVTPLLTILSTTGNVTDTRATPEVHLSCMKPLADTPPNQMVQQGGGDAVMVRRSLPTILIAILGYLIHVILMA